LRPDWEDIKYELMKNITRAYYDANDILKQKLIDTGNIELIHQGHRVDTFWGINAGKNGTNNHGKMLMELRSEFQ